MSKILAQLKDIKGTPLGTSFMVPTDFTSDQLDLLVRRLQLDLLETRSKQLDTFEKTEEEEHLSLQCYSYFVDGKELAGALSSLSSPQSEEGVTITFIPQALFRVRPATRCASTMSGHSEAILSVAFSPDGTRLASGSGDSTVRFWDTLTSTGLPCQAVHSSWVMVISWSPDGLWLASGSMDASIQVWDGENGAPVGRQLKGHSQCITQLAWQPLHLAETSRGHPLLASSSKDRLVKVWDWKVGACLYTLSQHTDLVSCLKWSGSGSLISGSRDRTIRIWSPDGKCIEVLKGHAHWVNSMALSDDYVLRTGPFDPAELSKGGGGHVSWAEKRDRALKCYSTFHSRFSPTERLVSSSDDFTLILWTLSSPSKSVRMTGHQALVTLASFSPDARWIASCSFDKSVKLWDGLTGDFIASFRGHVGPVYQLAWSSDSRLVVSGSKDSTLKLWDIKTKKLKMNLPGHLDEVYSVDWSPDGRTVASGSKDKSVKLWRH